MLHDSSVTSDGKSSQELCIVRAAVLIIGAGQDPKRTFLKMRSQPIGDKHSFGLILNPEELRRMCEPIVSLQADLATSKPP
ncbi:hypothetical protein T265_06724 [Opisthorchis viverrini]|uniref:Uncharacterized protein n=1 Tax=Opisthorchis viverrini TaxID=6198 RepID=A0A074ZFF1_OPIVI|nr:hypothetical protein T265_06724 [Opisthorchis viverrini]KER25918.1 hypothetical protein T265_06724 [Opisthorchis viverrini]